MEQKRKAINVEDSTGVTRGSTPPFLMKNSKLWTRATTMRSRRLLALCVFEVAFKKVENEQGAHGA